MVQGVGFEPTMNAHAPMADYESDADSRSATPALFKPLPAVFPDAGSESIVLYGFQGAHLICGFHLANLGISFAMTIV